MRSIATDGVAWTVCLCVCLSVGHVREFCKTAQLIEMPFRWLTRVGPRNQVLDCVEISTSEQVILSAVRPIEKHWEFLLRCTQQKGSFNPQ